jgi:glycosyltransferase involved in cell wall biosynthesis
MARGLLGEDAMRGVRPERIHVLYLTYDGLLEPLGRSQVVSYLLELPRGDLGVSVISFERREDLRDERKRSSLQAELGQCGVSWAPLLRHRTRPLAAVAWDLLRGIRASLSFAHGQQTRIVHARSYVAGLIGLAVKTLTGARLVFDMRGFWPEECLELGRFQPQGLLYSAAKLLEKRLLASADHVVVLTESAKALLREREAKDRLASADIREAPISVVPCCVDLERYRPLPRDLELARSHDLESSVVIGNIGAFNPRYLTLEMFRFAFHVKAHRPDLRFVYLTAQRPDDVRRVARDAGLDDRDVLVLRAEPSDVPRWLSLFRLGVFFLRPSYAAKASSFAKLGEFLAAGVPVVTNTGVGDVDRILASDRCGLVLPGLTDRDLSAFAHKALSLLEGDGVPEQTRRQCRAAAGEHFALKDGARRYRAIYDSLATSARPAEEAEIAAEVG